MGSSLDNTGISLATSNNNMQPETARGISDSIYLLSRLQTKLLRDLQSSLEIGDILNLFLRELKTLLPVEGVSYRNFAQELEYKTAKRGKHCATYHLNTDKETMGEVTFSGRQRFKESELNIFEDLMHCLFYPLRNALKYERAVKAASTDALTGCGNRTAMESAICREIQLAKRDGAPLSLIMFDFDHFKEVNDTYGHQCGDYVLKRVITETQSILRETDLVFRYGGEEFAILLHCTNQEGARVVAEKIRRCAEELKLVFKEQSLKVTLSLGATTMQENDSIVSMINRTDQSLYAAKHDGRNCVKCIA